MQSRFYARLLLAWLAVISCCAGANLTYLRLDPSILTKRFAMVPATLADRLSTLRSQFLSAGCQEPLGEQEVAGAASPNLVCTLTGSEPGTLVIAAQLDYSSRGDDERVQWATVELLPLLAESLRSSTHRHTLVLVALSGRKDEFAGSRQFLARLDREGRRNLLGIIYLDHLGRVPPAYAHSFTYRAARIQAGEIVRATVATSENVLTVNVGVAAQVLGVASPPAVDAILPTDTTAFHDAGIPAINFHSLDYITMAGAGQPESHQLRTAADLSVLGDTYNFLCVYVLTVDKLLGEQRSSLSDVESITIGPFPHEQNHV